LATGYIHLVTEPIPADLQAALAARFELRRVLGRGGMATVYLAHDRRHEREVAVKVLRQDLAASLGTERFLKEIQIAARLTHPHILTMHDSGEAGGFLYYVMPFIDGPSLRQRLLARGPIETAEVLSIASRVADALTYAHRMGVVHRDIKPENILFAEGHPIVADFGIAKAVSTAGDPNLTRTGFPVGTPGYMSPEQAAGLPDLDARTDVYSLAIVVYEMLIGAAPGHWPTEDAVRTGRFLEAQAEHRARLARVGGRIESALVRAMSIRLDQRTPTPGAFVEELTGAAPARRQYSDEEVKEIVRRAAELEATYPTKSGAMTVGGVEALAAEVGIAPEAVRAAVGSLTSVTPMPIEPNKKNRLIGGPTVITFERIIEGELPDSEYGVLVEEIQRTMGNIGQVSQLGRSFSWVATGTRNSGAKWDCQVSVTVRGGRTRILVRENLAGLIGGVWGGIGGGAGGGGLGPIMGGVAGGLHMPQLLPIIIPVWLGLVYSTARFVYAKTSGKRERTLRELADRLAALTGELIPRPALPRPRTVRT
jgi:serine/threonine protein kinase